MNTYDLGKLIIIIGFGLIIVGSILMLFGKFTALGHLPGDIFIKGKHGSFYFPIVSCALISIILSVILNFLK